MQHKASLLITATHSCTPCPKASRSTVPLTDAWSAAGPRLLKVDEQPGVVLVKLSTIYYVSGQLDFRFLLLLNTLLHKAVCWQPGLSASHQGNQGHLLPQDICSGKHPTFATSLCICLQIHLGSFFTLGVIPRQKLDLDIFTFLPKCTIYMYIPHH